MRERYEFYLLTRLRRGRNFLNQILRSASLNAKVKGFSLIETLIAITIIGVIGAITVTILTRSYKAGSNTDTISRLKQNGDSAINIMTETIRNADAVVCYGGTVDRRTEIVIRNLSGQYIKFKFVDPNPSTGDPTTNGFIIRQDNLPSASYPNFCDVTISGSQEVPITDNNAVTGVSVSDGEFTKLTNTASKDTILIEFFVNRSQRARSNFDSETAFFRTTVKVR